jgi:hypothetical protein
MIQPRGKKRSGRSPEPRGILRVNPAGAFGDSVMKLFRCTVWVCALALIGSGSNPLQAQCGCCPPCGGCQQIIACFPPCGGCQPTIACFPPCCGCQPCCCCSPCPQNCCQPNGGYTGGSGYRPTSAGQGAYMSSLARRMPRSGSYYRPIARLAPIAAAKQLAPQRQACRLAVASKSAPKWQCAPAARHARGSSQTPFATAERRAAAK